MQVLILIGYAEQVILNTISPLTHAERSDAARAVAHEGVLVRSALWAPPIGIENHPVRTHASACPRGLNVKTVLRSVPCRSKLRAHHALALSSADCSSVA